MPGHVAKVFHDDGRTDSMRRLAGSRRDLQYLAEGTHCAAGNFGCVIRTGIRDDHDPQRIVPT